MCTIQCDVVLLTDGQYVTRRPVHCLRAATEHTHTVCTVCSYYTSIQQAEQPFQLAPALRANSFFATGPYHSEPSRPTSNNSRRPASYYFWPQMFITGAPQDAIINLWALINQPRGTFCRCGIPMNIDTLIKLCSYTNTHTHTHVITPTVQFGEPYICRRRWMTHCHCSSTSLQNMPTERFQQTGRNCNWMVHKGYWFVLKMLSYWVKKYTV